MRLTHGELNELLQKHFNKMSEDSDKLFITNVDKDVLWNKYQDSFDPKYNQIYRERREHDCVACKQFIRKFGKVVAIKNNQLHTIWDLEIDSEEYSPVFKALSDYVKSEPVVGVFMINKELTGESKLDDCRVVGTPFNFEQLEDGTTKRWEHYALDIPNKFVYNGNKTLGTVLGEYNGLAQVFRRALNELTIDSLDTVIELIDGNVVPRGEEFESKAKRFRECKIEYDKLNSEELKINYAWSKTGKVGFDVAGIRNSAFGTLLVDISEGVLLDDAVYKYGKKVDENYKRTKTLYTKRQQEQAVSWLKENEYINSLAGKHSVLNDITVNNILFCDRNIKAKDNGILGMLEDMGKTVETQDVKKYSKVEEISIKDFITNVLPHSSSIEALIENRHSKDMVSLISPVNKDAKTITKWDNNFRLAYSGNMAVSSTRENVRKQGGNVEGDVRISMQWNEPDFRDENDYDLHVIEPRINNRGYEIEFGNKRQISPCGGMLDVDITQPMSQSKMEDKTAVENVVYKSIGDMRDGDYPIFVHNYSHNGGRNGFMIEIEILGDLYSFEHRQNVMNNAKIQIAKLVVKDGKVKVVEKLEAKNSIRSKEIWGINTNQFIPVSVISYSPNYWNEQEGIGNRHYLFMLKDCVNSEQPSAFFNEFLKGDLHEHRKFFEILGGKLKVEKTDEQLSGLGFPISMRNELIVKVKGSVQRIIRVKF